MKKLKPFFAAMKNADTLELTVYEDIGQDWFGDGISAKTVKEKIDAAGPVNRIAVRINSPGGDAFEGVAIYNLLRAQRRPIDVYVDGIAASAASIIAMAGDTITMGPNAMMMVHNAWTVCMGSAKDMRAQAEVLDRVSASIAQTYVTRSGQSLEDVTAMMDAESWLGAEACLEQGFCTSIAEFSEEGDAIALASSFKRLQNSFKNVPEQLRAKAAEGTDEATTPPTSEEESNLSLYEAKLRLLGLGK